MNKTTFLRELNIKLKNDGFQPQDIIDVLEDYESMIDEAIINGEVEAEFIERLGRVFKISKSLNLKKTTLYRNRKRLVALSPFVALILFFVIGFAFEGFGYSWLAFLLIPMTAILLEESGFERYFAIAIIMTVIVYYILGFLFSLWHPWCVIFTLLIPISMLGLGVTNRNVWVALNSVMLSGLYLFFELTQPEALNLLILLPLIPFALMSYLLRIDIPLRKSVIKDFLIAVGFIGVIVIIYLNLGFVFQFSNSSWILFLLIPIAGLLYNHFIKKVHQPLVAYTPYISVILFIIMGIIIPDFQGRWVIFLLMPIIGILENKKINEEIL